MEPCPPLFSFVALRRLHRLAAPARGLPSHVPPAFTLTHQPSSKADSSDGHGGSRSTDSSGSSTSHNSFPILVLAAGAGAAASGVCGQWFVGGDGGDWRQRQRQGFVFAGHHNQQRSRVALCEGERGRGKALGDVRDELNEYCRSLAIPAPQWPEFYQRGDHDVVKFRVRADTNLYELTAGMLQRLAADTQHEDDYDGLLVSRFKAYHSGETVQLQCKFRFKGSRPPGKPHIADNKDQDKDKDKDRIALEEDGSLDIFAKSTTPGWSTQSSSQSTMAVWEGVTGTGSPDNPVVELSKRRNGLTGNDVAAIKFGMQIGNLGSRVTIAEPSTRAGTAIRRYHPDGEATQGQPNLRPEALPPPPSGPGQQQQADSKWKVKEKLEGMGVLVHLPDDEKEQMSWQDLGGYDDVKQRIEECVLFSLTHPDLFAQITEGTRGKKGESNRPKVVLFEGPPGTGKTSSARIIAHQVQIPLLYLPLESVVSKWYGASEKNLATVFDMAKTLASSGGCIIFVDEIDALASSRDDMKQHEASKRILSVLLRKLDGFDTLKDKTMLICASNRKQDLDDAFLSRVDSSIYFPLPDSDAREKICEKYAQHLTAWELKRLANETKGLSGRNIKDLCQDAERRWASKIIRERKQQQDSPASIEGGGGPASDTATAKVTLPPFDFYLDSCRAKVRQQRGGVNG
ncbi:unnamed protein product [Vitrella brassicaformis CCMP3155]|uniref:AAA+ ATPase domain-containing protein n=2 Tax=Vitrella brassicaformis TaxID=1169539 RepID=A0A0G4H3B1_VITBC|nr:unnamed protein product [Vitrella brassicaformis CCMP3155]|eukprot:CEM37950.1 unnamed protein product [Vitrella brassicaformis CCMP3155]